MVISLVERMWLSEDCNFHKYLYLRRFLLGTFHLSQDARTIIHSISENKNYCSLKTRPTFAVVRLDET